MAPPIMWAVHNGHYYVAHLLLKHGADPLLKDAQGFNALHVAAKSGGMHEIILFLHYNLPVDVCDDLDHTPLMWAAYKGHPAAVDLFLKWGADVHARDDHGSTALHWALVAGNYKCIQKLIEYGSDRFLENGDGKPPNVVAEEMGTLGVWEEALNESGYNKDGTPKRIGRLPIFLYANGRKDVMQKFYFTWPGVIMGVLFFLFARLPIFLSVPVGIFIALVMHGFATKLLALCPYDMKELQKTPYLAGVFGGTVFWGVYEWLFALLPSMSLPLLYFGIGLINSDTYAAHPFQNMFLLLTLSLTLYFYAASFMMDPGYVPKLSSLTEQKAVIEELLSLWKYDNQNFCVTCMVRRPLRSKHCKPCGRCVAKHDQ